MTLLHWWALGVGAGAIALPVLIHLLTRPRPRRLALSTIRFVREAIRERRARHRLRDAIILALRTLAVLLIAWAFARPLVGEKPLISPDAEARAVRVVILDCSQSMAAEKGGIDSFARAKPVAARYAAATPGVRVNVILAAAQPRAALERPTGSAVGLQDELAAAQPMPQRLNVPAALRAAARMFELAPGEGTLRELVIVSDFQRSNWVSADFSVLPDDTLIQLESVGAAEALPNIAVLRVGAAGRCEQGREARLEVEVGNYSSTPREVQADVTLGESTFHLAGLCPAGGKTTLMTEVTLDVAGWQAGEAKLAGVEDALAADDRRAFVVHVKPAPVYALVTRESPDPRPTSSHFLERALAPTSGRSAPHRAGEKVVRLSPTQLDQQTAAGADLIVLDHPGKLSPESIQLLAAVLRRGRPVLYVATEPIDATNLKLLSQAAGGDLKMPVAFMPAPSGAARRDRFLTVVRQDDAPFRGMGESARPAIASLRFASGLVSQRLEGGLGDDVLASYSDGSACLVVSACGSGTLGVLNADLVSSNLHASPLLVPLVGELLSRMMIQSRDQPALESGESLSVELPLQTGPAAGLKLVGVESADAGTLVEENNRVTWRLPPAAPPGVYRAVRGDATVFAAATELTPEESDLRALTPELLRERLAGGRKVHFQPVGGSREANDRLWSVLAVACVLCLLGELVALKLFRT